MHFIQLLIERVRITVDVLFNDVKNRLKLFNLGANVILQVVEDNCDRYGFKDVQLLSLIVLLQVQKQVVLRSEGAMATNVVYNLL